MIFELENIGNFYRKLGGSKYKAGVYCILSEVLMTLKKLGLKFDFFLTVAVIL